MSDQLSINWNKYKYTSIYDIDKTTNNVGSLVDQQMKSLDSLTIQNFDSLVKKFPNQSKDYLLSAAKIGLNANTQGIEKLSANDGIAQLKQDLTNYDNITNRAKTDKGFRESIYGVLKGTTRALFATLQAPYQYVSTVGRDLYAMSKGEISTSQLIKDASLTGLFGETTNLGQLLRSTAGLATGNGPVDAGSGFFVSPESKVGAGQAKAMSAYGRINGKSFTIGRAGMSALGADPNSTPYRVMSGIVDGVLAVGTDPSLWVGPGSVTKIIQGGKQLSKAKTAAQAVEEAKQAAKIADIKNLTKEEKALIKERNGTEKVTRRKVNNTYMQAEKSLAVTEQSKSAAVSKRLEKALIFTAGRGSKIEGDPSVAALIENGSIGDFVLKNIAEQKPEGLINSISQLEADYINTNKAFTGIYFNEVPEAGRLQIGAFDGGEYVATVSSKDPLVINDIAKTYENSTQAERLAEYANREALFEKLYSFTDDVSIPQATRIAIDDFIGNTPTGRNALKDQADSLVFGDGSESLAKLIARAAATKNEHLMQYLTEAIQTTYNVDGFTNVRAIYGSIGGTVITQASKIGARRVGISDVLTSMSGKSAMGSELGAKLIESVKSAQQEIIDASNAFDSAKATRAGLDGKLKEIEILRDYAAQDPELVAQLLNDPENFGIAKLMELEMNIADTNYLKEFHRSEVGIIDGFGGAVKGDLNKAATYLLGKRFAQIADIVANEKDFARLHRLFGRKLDVEMTQELVAATTSDEVISIFLKHLAAPTTDPQVYRSLALKGEAALAARNPLLKVVPPGISQRALQFVEKTEKNFGRYFTKSIVLPLDDLDRLINGMEDWMSSAKIPDEIINTTLNRIASATSVEQRSGIVFQEIEKAQLALADRLAPGDTALAEAVKEAFRITGRENAIIKQYTPEKLAKGELPSLDGVLLNGQTTTHTFAGDQAIFEYQFLDDVIRLPDTKDISKLISKYNDSKVLYGTKQSLAVFSAEIGDRWRTAQLAFRVAYIMRNIGEMQFRQYFSGHESLFNHPLNYIAMIAGNPNGGAGRKLLASIAKYGNDVQGNKLIGKDAEANVAISQFVEENFNFLARNHNSGDPRFAFVGKIYEALGVESDRYHIGLANTLIRAHSDALIPIVANTVEGTEDLVVNALIAGTDEKFAGVLQNLINGGKNGVQTGEFAKLFLKDSKKVNGKYNLSADNIIPENIKIYLFDKNSTGSVARYVSNIIGNGPGSVNMRRLLADGQITMNGKTIKIPRYSKVGNINDFADEDGIFKTLVARNFPKEDMAESTVIHVRDKRFGPQDTKYLDEAVNKFFDIATKVENVVNFSPEFRMSYWDHVGRYVGMINDEALGTLLVNAKKSLAPLTINGKNISLKRHPSLRAINKEIAARKKGKSVTNGIDLDTMNSMAATKASKYTKDLFYDASKQRQYANAMRIIFPFAQAQFNTMYKWSQLVKQNPVQFYKLGRGYNALTQPGASAIYDATATKYEENEGFFYKDEFGEQRFRYPLAGSIIGALAGKNIDTAQALQITAPVQSLNLVFGAVNPAVPGIGPMGQILYATSGKSKAFGPQWDALRSTIFPFGEPSGLQDFLLPAWLKKSFLLAVNNDTQVERGVKDWASYLASTGNYGDNPLANDAERNQLFNDARGLSRATGFMTALFQSIAPATPSQEVFAKDLDGKLRNQTAIYSAFEQINKNHPGDYFGAVGEFSDTFGIKNLLVILAGSTRSVRGTGDAWDFLNNNPSIAEKYATATGDVVPYFFPGGEAATAYYNWQKATGRRRVLRPEELEKYAENIVYQMAVSQVSTEQADMGYSDVWRTQKIIELNDKFGGSAPVMNVDIGTAQDKLASVEKALNEPAFQQSPVYKETKEFYDAYKQVEEYLQEIRTSADPKIGSGFWYAKEEAKKLDNFATQLMIQNPAFSRMYYGVFSSLVKVG